VGSATLGGEQNGPKGIGNIFVAKKGFRNIEILKFYVVSGFKGI